MENNIDSDINEGGGNTYITSGEAGNLLANVSIVYNTFQGILGTVTENTNQHASFILGAYAYVNHNYFNVTSTFNSGDTINAPEMEFDEFQTNGVSNVSYNYFYGLSSVAVAIAFIPVSSATNYGTEILYANEYRGSNSAYQITAYTGYTINAINKTNYQYLTNNGTVSMVSGNSPNGYTANSYAKIILFLVFSSAFFNINRKYINLISLFFVKALLPYFLLTSLRNAFLFKFLKVFFFMNLTSYKRKRILL